MELLKSKKEQRIVNTTKLYRDVEVQLAIIKTNSGLGEYHLLVNVTNPALSFPKQLDSLIAAYRKTVNELPGRVVPLIRRYFMSDASNQETVVKEADTQLEPCAVSYVQQPPLNGTKLALWVYLQADVPVCRQQNGLYTTTHNGYIHYWTATCPDHSPTSATQTRQLLETYAGQLAAQACTLADNCLRTWFFVQNVDVNYAGVVDARKELFMDHNLTEKTHYITSTGIEGRNSNSKVLATMDAYAVKGLQPGQITYLYAPTHLNPTYEYGVTFEGGVAVTYGDRKHLFLSGTASIDNKGAIVYPGDIIGQTGRMMENVAVLLEEGGATTNDIVQSIIYLRDTADYQVVKRFFDTFYPSIPRLIVLAPVCRPGWLIEMECIAVVTEKNHAFRDL